MISVTEAAAASVPMTYILVISIPRIVAVIFLIVILVFVAGNVPASGLNVNRVLFYIAYTANCFSFCCIGGKALLDEQRLRNASNAS